MKKKLLPILLVLCMIVSMLPAPVLAAQFDDVEGHWGEEAIERWAGYGVLNGKGENTFDPNGVMTRAEFATMLVNMMGYTQTSDETFTDLDPDAWYADAISKLVAAGVMNGKGNGMVDPLGQITREQAAVMLCRAFSIEPSGNGSLNFNDSEKVSDWAVDAMTALAERGMINGVGGNLLSPGGIVNRATAAQLTSNMVAEYVTSDTTLTGEITGVVIVAKGAKVEIKDATVTAPIVVESASVTLTNTQAEDVKAAGEKSSVTADEKSSVANVTLAGEAPTAEIKGAVSGTVTVEEGATGVTANVPKGTSVSNQSGGVVSVNGSEVESGTVATAPETPSKPSEPSYPSYGGGGSGSGGTNKPPEDTTGGNEAEKEEDTPATKDHTHNYKSEVTKAATCTTAGEMTYTCQNEEGCTNKTYTEAIPATGHSWKTEAEEDGSYKCANENCTATKPEQECETHTYVETKVEATCLAAGKITKVCSVCGDKVEETIPKSEEHTTKKLEAVPSTCTKKGLTEGEQCTVCGKVTKAQESTDYAAHQFGDEVVEKTGDCTKGITYTKTCKNCTSTQTRTTAPASKHAWGTGENAGKCTTTDCTVTCNHEGHWNEGVENPKATCTTDGTKTFTCTVCGATKTEKTTAFGHSYDKENPTGKCTTCGEACDHGETAAGETCGTCGMTLPKPEPEPEPKHEHKYTEWKSDGKGGHTRTCNGSEGKCDATEADLKGTCDTYGTDGSCSVCGYNPNASSGGSETDENQGGSGGTGDPVSVLPTKSAIAAIRMLLAK